MPWQAAILPYVRNFRCLDIYPQQVTSHSNESKGKTAFSMLQYKKSVFHFNKPLRSFLVLCLLYVIAIMKILQYVVENVVSYSGTEENGKNYRLLKCS